jgi:uncharacterized protein YbjT (DUF2867 family)
MRIAVVGATGRIGTPLTRALLHAGHEVRALSRGGLALDKLVEAGAEPFLGSFDTGDGDLGKFFADADAAFLMVKTDWNNIHGHYSEVALRFFDALRDSSVKRVVSLTGMGSEVCGSTGHFQPFYQLDQILDRLGDIDMVYLQAGWFMENLSGWIASIAKYDRLAWSLKPDIKAPWAAIDDIADLAAKLLTEPDGRHRVTIGVGADYTTAEIAAIIGKAIGKPVEYRFVDQTRSDVEAVFRERFGTLEKWLDEMQTMAAINDGRVRFGDDRAPLPISMKTFVEEVFAPRYRQASASAKDERETFVTWSASPALDAR